MHFIKVILLIASDINCILNLNLDSSTGRSAMSYSCICGVFYTWISGTYTYLSPAHNTYPRIDSFVTPICSTFQPCCSIVNILLSDHAPVFPTLSCLTFQIGLGPGNWTTTLWRTQCVWWTYVPPLSILEPTIFMTPNLWSESCWSVSRGSIY